MHASEIAEITGTWDFSDLPRNVHIGPGCFIERKASFARYRSTQERGLVLGPRVRVYTWTEFNIEPTGSVEIGGDSTIVGAVFMCAGSISIGQRVIVSYNVTIADCDFHPRGTEERRRDAIANAPYGDKSARPSLVARPVTIADDVWIGIGAIILKGVHIGSGARIDAGAVVTHDIPARAVVSGNPARIVEQEGPDAANSG